MKKRSEPVCRLGAPRLPLLGATLLPPQRERPSQKNLFELNEVVLNGQKKYFFKSRGWYLIHDSNLFILYLGLCLTRIFVLSVNLKMKTFNHLRIFIHFFQPQRRRSFAVHCCKSAQQPLSADHPNIPPPEKREVKLTQFSF